jgi:hypothetical protein
MPTNNLILLIIHRGEKILLTKQAGKKALWTLPGGHIVLRSGFTHAAYLYLRPYFRDLFILRVRYLHSPIDGVVSVGGRKRVILIGCDLRGTVKKEVKDRVWFVKIGDIVNHVVVPGTIELLSLARISNRLI